MNKNKILIFSLAYHPFVGGAEVAIKEITNRPGDDFQFDMITVNLDGKQKPEEKIGNVNVYRIGNSKLSKYIFPWLAFKKAKELNKENNYNLIWAMMANQAGWAAIKFKKQFPRTKYLLTLQEGDSEWDIMIRTWFVRWKYKQIYRQADYIQAISTFLEKRAENLGAKCEIEVVPNGIKTQNVKRKTQNDNAKLKRVITVSRLVEKNGVEDLIRAMNYVDGKLIILGDGKLRKKLNDLTKELKLEEKIEFKGEVSNDEVYKYLNQADVFVRPSLSEGLGNAFLEAMTMRVPVIATPVGGIPDFLIEGKTGWFCKVKDPKSIAEKINYILDRKNQEEVKRVVQQASDLVIKKYNWNDVSNKIKNIFNKLIKK